MEYGVQEGRNETLKGDKGEGKRKGRGMTV
jgi:hypothetical protein